MHRLPTAPLRPLTALVTTALLASACATVQTTDSGAIGLERKQYFAEGAREAVRDAAEAYYDEHLEAALAEGALNADPAQVDRVVAIANRLIPHVAGFRPDALDWAWEVNVVSVDEVNATCMAGGKIFVYTGLLDTWQPTDDELAAVIGHEIAHALRDHSAEKYSTRNRNSAIASGLGAILSVGLAVTTGVNLSNTIDGVSQISAEAFANLPNSRELELESDRIGLELMARAGYDPQAAVSLWTKVAEQARAAGKEGDGRFWSTHPSDASRVEDLSRAQPLVRPLYEQARAAAAGAGAAR
ncbi:MAG: M48 family metallopeptidase [Rhodocyclaceae bacterium]|nr:M48 family metallopeptidase [Rhodocyclaceae bacterium]